MFKKFLLSNAANQKKYDLKYSENFEDFEILSNSKLTTWTDKNKKYILIGSYYGESDRSNFKNFQTFNFVKFQNGQTLILSNFKMVKF